MKKPVWRMNTGNEVPSDLGKEAIFKDGSSLKDFQCWMTDDMWSIDGEDSYDIYAYQTNRTKESKHE